MYSSRNAIKNRDKEKLAGHNGWLAWHIARVLFHLPTQWNWTPKAQPTLICAWLGLRDCPFWSGKAIILWTQRVICSPTRQNWTLGGFKGKFVFQTLCAVGVQGWSRLMMLFFRKKSRDYVEEKHEINVENLLLASHKLRENGKFPKQLWGKWKYFEYLYFVCLRVLENWTLIQGKLACFHLHMRICCSYVAFSICSEFKMTLNKFSISSTRTSLERTRENLQQSISEINNTWNRPCIEKGFCFIAISHIALAWVNIY